MAAVVEQRGSFGRLADWCTAGASFVASGVSSVAQKVDSCVANHPFIATSICVLFSPLISPSEDSSLFIARTAISVCSASYVCVRFYQRSDQRQRQAQEAIQLEHQQKQESTQLIEQRALLLQELIELNERLDYEQEVMESLSVGMIEFENIFIPPFWDNPVLHLQRLMEKVLILKDMIRELRYIEEKKHPPSSRGG
jgi:hypothetical protein